MDLRNKIGQMFRYKIVAKEGTAKEGTAKEGTAKEGIISPPPMEFSLAIEAGSILVGFIGIVIFASQAKSIKDGMSVFGTGLLIALASFLIGALLGFVFGIPRFLQKEQTTEYQENTNLEQISDWLTKILVGVGLVQITLFWQEIPKIAAYISPALGGFSSSGIFGVAIIFYFLIDGFFIIYLWTRLNMAETMKEHRLILEKGATYQRDIDALKAQESVLYQKGSEKISSDDLIKKFREVSSDALDLIYHRTEEYWKEHNYGAKASEKVIPICKALIENREESPYWHHALLGIAYMHLIKPDYEHASKKLTYAIDLRGSPPSDPNDYVYELQRAICNIRLNESEPRDVIPKDSNGLILKDLLYADTVYFPQWLNKKYHEIIKNWLNNNKELLYENAEKNAEDNETIKRWLKDANIDANINPLNAK